MNRTLNWLLLTLCTGMPVLAQDVESPESKEISGRKAWFVQTVLPEGMENPVMVMAGTEMELVTLSNRMASGPIKIPSDGIIRLVREIPDPENPAKTKQLTLAEAHVPKETSNALIIMVPTPKRDGSDLLLQTKVMNLSDFNGGDCLYINLTNVNVSVEIGGAKIPLKPGNSTIYDGAAYEGAATVPFRYSYFHPEKKEWKVLSASVAIMSGTRREIWIFSIDPAMNRVKCHGVTFPVTQ